MNPPPELDATLTSRYECKYLIDARVAQSIRTYLEAHAALDPHSEHRPDHRYRVFSLYLDTRDLDLYQGTAQGVRNRFKLRLRYYADVGEGPIFFEVKKRSDVVVRKSRGRVTREEATDFLLFGHCDLGADAHGDAQEFLDRCRTTRAYPALRLRYWREAWESRGVDPVRITFDTSLEHCLLADRGLVETRPDWRFTPLGNEVILEVKFTDLRPHWLDEMLRRFNLDKVSVAKYAESIEQVQRSGRLGALEAGMLLAERRAAVRSRNLA